MPASNRVGRDGEVQHLPANVCNSLKLKSILNNVWTKDIKKICNFTVQKIAQYPSIALFRVRCFSTYTDSEQESQRPKDP